MPVADAVAPNVALAERIASGRVWSSFADFLAASRLLRKIPHADARAAAFAGVRVALIGNATMSYIADALALALAPRLAGNVYTAAFDQWPQELLDPTSGLARFAPDVVVLHLASLGLTAGGTRLDAPPADLVRDAIAAFATRSSAPLIVVAPDPLPDATGGSGDADRWFDDARATMVAAINAALPERSVVLDPMPALEELGRGRHAGAYWQSAKLPFHPMGCVALGRRIAQTVENLTYPRIKVVAVDCDDTLWGGIVGDVGAEGVGLSPHDGGAGHLRLQRLLKEASARGILLVAVSKNDPASVSAVFRERASEMVLSEDDFAAFKVGWGPKSVALREVAADLRLGLDAFLFLDDSAFERGEVRAAVPDVVVPELPPSADEVAAFVARLGLLERPLVGEEDRARTALYRQERARSEQREAASSPEDYLASLGLEVIATPVSAASLDRVAQLVAKTNQFNLTTRRYAREELATLAADASTYAYAFRVIDRFGDAGVIGVLIATPCGPGEATIDAFVMSCRVMARTVEHAMFEHLVEWQARRGVTLVHGAYVPTAKNALVADLLPTFGFTASATSGDRVAYRYDVAGTVRPRHFATLRESA